MYILNSFFSIDFDSEKVYIGKYPIDLEKIQIIIGKIIQIIIILILMAIAIKVGNYIINRFVKRQAMSRASFTLDEKKATTIGEVLKSILRYSVYFFGVAAIVANIFTGISLTLASIGGVALGFGAQNLVKDLINGFFILFEDQYAVGDYVTIGSFSGTVETIGIRTTVLKGFSGDIHLIPNGTIQQVTNHSRGAMKVEVDVVVPYKENYDKVSNIINNACKKVVEENENVIDEPKVLGIVSLDSSSMTMRVNGTSKPMGQWEIERTLKKEIKKALEEGSIEIPYPRTEMITIKSIDNE